jgi:HEAT repeat protein
MKSSSSEANELLKKLARSASWWRRFFESTDAEEIHKIISDLPPLDLATLDQRARGHNSYRYYAVQNWHGLRPSDVSRLARSKFAVSLVGLASFHHSGYVREAAVEELITQSTGRELPFLLIRLNDWVSQVRDNATKAVRVRVEPKYAVHFLANISLVLRLRSCGRVDKKFVDEICGLLKRPESKEVLQAGMASKDKAIRRISFQLATEADPSMRTSIIRAVMTDPDAVARSWAVRHFLPDVTPDELPGVIEPMLKDRFMPVRRDALWAIATKRPDLAVKPLRSALLDDHISMRETARQFLAVADVKDVRAFYAEAVERGDAKQRFAAIFGLGESGLVSDVKRMAPFLNSKLTKFRRAAVYAIGKLDVEGQLEKLAGFLSDEKPSVSREALKALLPKARHIPLADLEHLIAGGANFYVRRNALKLVLHAGKWKKIPALLEACADSEARLAEQATKALHDWSVNYNGSFAEPTREDFERIQTALSKFEKVLPHKFADDLRACLKIYFK